MGARAAAVVLALLTCLAFSWWLSGARWVRPSSVAPAEITARATSGLAWAEDHADDAEERFRLVERVIDGDTLVLEGGERVRLIGVDTPETVHPQKPVEYFGKEASKFTRGMVEGKRARLEYEHGVPQKDRYGRTLAYVYLENGMLLNLEIIERGYGHAYTRFPFSKMEEFRDLSRVPWKM